MRGTTIQGVVALPGTGKYIIIRPQSVKEFSLTLDPKTHWYLGIDQSTSCTGLTFKAANNKFVVLIDVIRDKYMQKDDYFKDLRKVIMNTARDQQFDLVVNEKPVPKKCFAHARDTLLELLGRLNVWIEDTPEFENAQHGAVFPQTWKSQVMDKSKGKNRSNIKSEVASDLVDKYPELKYYYDFYHTDDYDSFDSLGILDGYISYAFTSDGYPQIHGSKEKRHASVVLYDWIDIDDSLSFEQNIEIAIGDNISIFQPYILRYNVKYSLHDNIRMASSNFGCVATLLPKSELAPFRWKFGIDPEMPGKALMAIIMKRGDFSAALLRNIKEVYTWNEEMFDE
jgi:hypothetical protein